MTPRHDFDSTAGHGEWDALAVGWAMSALDPEDEAIFLPHLATCDQCARTVAETTRTVGELAWAVPAETPPPALRDRLMSAVHAEPRTSAPPATPPLAVPPPLTGPPPGTPAGRPGVVEPRSGDAPDAVGSGVVVPFRRRLGRRPLAAAAAAAAVIAGLGGWNAKLHGDQSDLQRRVAQRNAVIQELTKPGAAVVVALDSPGGQRVATVVARSDQSDVVTEALPATSGDTTYWLWAMRSVDDPQPRPIAGFTVGSDDVSVHAIGSGLASLPRPTGSGAYAVSREHGTGTPARPTVVVAVGQFG
jgi:anti-sigma factor RsiW